MAEAAVKQIKPAATEDKPSAKQPTWHPFETLRREIDRLFDDAQKGQWRSPFSLMDIEPLWRGEMTWGKVPAVDIAEKEKSYEVTAELPGMKESDIEVKYAAGTLTIRGEKMEEKEEKGKDRYLSERRFGSFSRSFRLPEGVDEDKIEASFKNGVLTVTLPKTAEAVKKAKKIDVKSA
jgi:HSP20 family protein